MFGTRVTSSVQGGKANSGEEAMMLVRGHQPWAARSAGWGQSSAAQAPPEHSHSWEFLVSSKHSLNSFIISVSRIKAVRREHVKIAMEQDNGCKRTKSRKPLPEWFPVLSPRRESVKQRTCSSASKKWLVSFACVGLLLLYWQKSHSVNKWVPSEWTPWTEAMRVVSDMPFG